MQIILHGLHWIHPHMHEVFTAESGIILFFLLTFLRNTLAMLSLSPSLPIALFCLSPPLSLPLPLFILLAVQQAPEPKGKSCSQGNGNSPQSWYQNSLKCELSDSSQWVRRRAKHFQIPLPAECKQSRGLGECAAQPVVFRAVWLAGTKLSKTFLVIFFKLKVVCCFCSKSHGCAGGDSWWGNILSEPEYWDEPDVSRVISPRPTLTSVRKQRCILFWILYIKNA